MVHWSAAECLESWRSCRDFHVGGRDDLVKRLRQVAFMASESLGCGAVSAMMEMTWGAVVPLDLEVGGAHKLDVGGAILRLGLEVAGQEDRVGGAIFFLASDVARGQRLYIRGAGLLWAFEVAW